jgi:hypothetical protein
MKSYPLIKEMENGKKIPKEEVMNLFESFRSKDPVVYNKCTEECDMPLMGKFF